MHYRIHRRNKKKSPKQIKTKKRLKQKEPENLVEKLMTENFSSLKKKVNIQVHEALRISNRLKTEKVESSKIKVMCHIKENPYKISVNFSVVNFANQEDGLHTAKVFKGEKKVQ
jgi:hypothetical protein